MTLKNKHIILAISGGIAVYKTCELLRQLQKEGAVVRVMMTESATKFVTPLTFESLSNHEVAYKMFPENKFIATKHIDWADWADCIVFAPATANVIGKIASGLSDDIVTTVACAFPGPKLIAPAMNSNMWANPIVQDNLQKLTNFGYHIVPTESGELACGWIGEGRLAPWQHIIQYVYKALSTNSLKDKSVIVTSGASIEDIDPVRFISNRSTGKMGHSLAFAAWCLGANVTLISGNATAEVPYEVTFIPTRSSEEMYTEAKRMFPASDIYISAAAIADYTPQETHSHKLKKSDDALSIPLKCTKDILSELNKIKKKQLLVGFAVETQNEIEHSTSKLNRKGLDYIILNNPLKKGAGFASDTNEVTLISKMGTVEEIPQMSKRELAFDLLNKISEGLNA